LLEQGKKGVRLTDNQKTCQKDPRLRGGENGGESKDNKMVKSATLVRKRKGRDGVTNQPSGGKEIPWGNEPPHYRVGTPLQRKVQHEQL